MLNASYSWRGNDIIRKKISRINDTVTKMSISIWNEVLLIKFRAITSSITYSWTFEKYASQ